MSAPDTCDIAVVGAGPAGATAAYLLANRGYEVCLLDKQAFPRPKPCAGLLTWKTIDLLQRIFNTGPDDLSAQGIITQTCKDYRIHVGQREIAHGHLDFPFHFVDRERYDHHWMKAARNAGAGVHTRAAVTNVNPVEGLLTLGDGSRIRARCIIGADGVWSTVRRAIHGKGRAERQWRSRLAITIETHQARSEKPICADLHFGVVPWGYAWSFAGAHHQTIGLAALPQKHQSIKYLFGKFLAANEMDALGMSWRGYPLPYGNFLTTPAKEKALLVGDACGLADPLLGEGIYYAHRSAQIAAHAILNTGPSFYRVADLYTQSLNRNVLKELRWIKVFRDLIFIGGKYRRFRGLKFFFRMIPKRLEAAVQGTRSFSRLLRP